ncbi:MAG: hypothetical protein ACI8V2_000095 [Candidatus Latescibacterota bacterium]|jgi:hypothetical protein
MRELEKLADEIARKIDRAVNDVEKKVKNRVKDKWQSQVHRTQDDFRATTDSFKRVPDRLSDLATDGGCAMRYLAAYGMKGFGLMMGLGGLIAASIGAVEQDYEPICAGLSLLVFSQIMWWGGNRFKKSAESRAYARDQHRILRLAREKDGSLTVLEVATDIRMTVEKAEEILRELAARGHTEMRISESGMIVYYFPEIERWEERHWAKRVDDLI